MLATLEAGYLGKLFVTFMISMVPVVELRGGIPFGAALGLDPLSTIAAAVIGNLVPVPFIIIFVERIFNLLRRYKRTARIVEVFERKAHIQGRKVQKYRSFGLCVLVAIPLPGTGAWTGAMVAAILGMRVRSAVIPIIIGVLIAAAIVSCLTWGIITVLA